MGYCWRYIWTKNNHLRRSSSAWGIQHCLWLYHLILHARYSKILWWIYVSSGAKIYFWWIYKWPLCCILKQCQWSSSCLYGLCEWVSRSSVSSSCFNAYICLYKHRCRECYDYCFANSNTTYQFYHWIHRIPFLASILLGMQHCR